MPRTFLVATDLSPRADRAVQRAFRLARALDAELVLVAVIDEDLPVEIARQLSEAAEIRLGQFAASMPHSRDVRHDTRIVIGDPARAIPSAAAELGADLLILGLHRRRDFLDMIRETTMERIVRHCGRPVLLVHDPADHVYARVLAALDFGPASTAALTLAAAIAPEADLFGLHALHVPYRSLIVPHGGAGVAASFRRSAEMQLKAWRAAEEVPAHLKAVDIVEGAAHLVLSQRIAELKPDLLSLGAHGRVGAAPALLGSLANDVMRDPPCDVLIARPAAPADGDPASA
jgi:nucleotide-binding universal stress UspA family protein